MDTPTAIKTLNGNSSAHKPFFGVPETTNIHYLSFAHKINARNVSFSPSGRAEQAQDDVGCTVDDSDIFDAQKYFNETNDRRDNKRVSLAIGNSILHEHNDGRSSISSVDGYGRNNRAHSFHATPTASSEASWNSQTGLLCNPPGSIAVSMRNLPVDGKSRGSGSSGSAKWFFGRKCPCSGKKSVRVEEKLSSRTTSAVNDLYSKRRSSSSGEAMIVDKMSLTNSVGDYSGEKVVPNCESNFPPENHFGSVVGHHHQRLLRPVGRPFADPTGGFSFSIPNPSSQVKLVLKGMPPPPPAATALEDPPRDSLEVFQPTPDDLVSSKLAIHPVGDRDRRGFEFPGSPVARSVTVTEDDVASNASSDLFEIESFSTQTTSYAIPMYRRRDSLDEATSFGERRAGVGGLYCRSSLDEAATPSIAPTECYEPSEASIDWSVTTAEGASVASFPISSVSEFQYMAMKAAEKNGNGNGNGNGSGMDDGGKRRGGNGLLSCRHEKAVSVGPQPVRCGAGWHRNDPPPFPLNSTAKHVSGRPPSLNNKPPLVATPRTARLSLAFAT